MMPTPHSNAASLLLLWCCDMLFRLVGQALAWYWTWRLLISVHCMHRVLADGLQSPLTRLVVFAKQSEHGCHWQQRWPFWQQLWLLLTAGVVACNGNRQSTPWQLQLEGPLHKV